MKRDSYSVQFDHVAANTITQHWPYPLVHSYMWKRIDDALVWT